MKPFKNHIAVFLFLSAILLNSFTWAKNQIIEIDHSPFELNLDEVTVPLLIQQSVVEGDITIRTHRSKHIEITVEDIDDAPMGKKAFFVFNSTNGTISLSLNGNFAESDTEWIVPETASFSIQTVEGDVTIENIQGDIDCSSSDGSIELLNVAGRISAATQDGDITIHLSDRVSVYPISVSSEDGDIELALPPDPNVKISASTMDGNISCDFALQPGSRKDSSGRNRSIWTSILSENTLIGMIGDGSLPIQLHTLDGDIAIIGSDFQ
jgi:DUF4097 and DUF4098 domain-containing protein YvlB